MKMKVDPAKIVIKLALSSVFAAVVCVATLAFRVDIPATHGYFNIGETAIYVAALLFGPLVGALSGGAGAAIADLVGYPEFFIGTLVIKGFEGAIVGLLGRRLLTQITERKWRVYTILLAVILGVLLAVLGSTYYVGDVALYLGFSQSATPTLTIFVPREVWYLLGGIVALTIAIVGFRIDPESGRAIVSMIAGGLEMVVGYFLYEQLILGSTTALVEIPVNIGQMIVGLVVAIPIVRIATRSLPQLKN
jgi:uncharacterized membrane protein